MKRSAGILVYKKENNDIKVLLCHFGGPFWAGMDNGAWSLSKGEVEKHEHIINTAKREFKEETNLDINTDIKYLASRKVSGNKLVIMFYANSDFDLTNCKSNTFKLEEPFGSGNFNTYPEMDDYAWFSLNVAKEKIVSNQLFFLNRLEDMLKEV
jgi:predicted NUDIX family NTP pyrophosphohydrolase